MVVFRTHTVFSSIFDMRMTESVVVEFMMQSWLYIQLFI